MMANNSGSKVANEKLQRFLAGIEVTCLIVVIIASAVGGGSLGVILQRGLIFLVLYRVGKYALVRAWVRWEELTRSAPKAK